MPQQIEAPDGSIVEFPDGMSDDQISAVMRKTYAGGRAAIPATPKRSMVQDVTGATANFNRGLGVGDELAAGFAVAQGLATGRHRFGTQKAGNIFANNAEMLKDAYKNELAGQRGSEDSYSAEHPHGAALARGTGMAATAAIPAGQTANLFAQGSRVANMARGATTAGLQSAAYAATDRGSGAERLSAASRAALDPVALGLGAVGGGIATPKRMPKPAAARAPSNGEILADIGVSTTIPQRAGKAVKAVEDLGKRAPILGTAMAGYQERQLGQLNRGVALKALQPVGLGIPKDIKPGFDMVEHVDDALGTVYSRAARMAPKVKVDEPLIADFARIGTRRADLAESEARQFDNIVGDRLKRLESGEASGDMVKTIHSELGKLQAEQARKGNDTLASMLGETRRAVMGLVERASPEAGKLIKKADEGWKIYSIMNDAAAAASKEGGVYLPGQLNTQVRRAGKAMGSNMTGKGRAPLQDIATAASQTIPDSYGNPGTANAVGLGSGLVGLFTAPAQTLGVAAGLGAAATPYLLAGRKVLESLPDTAGRSELQAAERRLAELAAKDPAVAALRREVGARLARVGAIAASAPSARNIFAQSGNP